MDGRFLSSSMNTNVSELRGNDLRSFLLDLEEYFLVYRDTLGLANEQFGTEIEYQKASKDKVAEFIRNHKDISSDWCSVYDGTVMDGGEVRSPVMMDRKCFWAELKLILDFLKSLQVDTSQRAGGHIHVSAAILGDDFLSWRVFLKLVSCYEHVLYRFFFGDKSCGRETISHYAPPISKYIYSDLSIIDEAQSFKSLCSYFRSINRYSSINFKNVNTCHPYALDIKNTIEFRMPNATTNEVVLQNNINTAVKMVRVCKMGVINEDFLNYKLKYHYNSHVEKFCNTICLKDALEFADLVFDNNLDKIYFLRQYFKDFSETYGEKPRMAQKIFVK